MGEKLGAYYLSRHWPGADVINQGHLAYGRDDLVGLK